VKKRNIRKNKDCFRQEGGKRQSKQEKKKEGTNSLSQDRYGKKVTGVSIIRNRISEEGGGTLRFVGERGVAKGIAFSTSKGEARRPKGTCKPQKTHEGGDN